MDKLPVTFDPLELVLLKQYNSNYEDFHLSKPILFDSFVYCGLGQKPCNALHFLVKCIDPNTRNCQSEYNLIGFENEIFMYLQTSEPDEFIQRNTT